jgi:hypothetical protein
MLHKCHKEWRQPLLKAWQWQQHKRIAENNNKAINDDKSHKRANCSIFTTDFLIWHSRILVSIIVRGIMAHRFANTSALRAIQQVCHGGHTLVTGRVSSHSSQLSKDQFHLQNTL